MKFVGIAALAVLLMSCQGNTQNKSELKTPKDTVSYGIGLNIGKNFKAQSIEVNPDLLLQGIKDQMAGGKTLITEEQAQSAIMAMQHEGMSKLLEKNKKDSEAFLAENKKKDGVKTTASGLQYKIITEGTGPKPKADQKVSINYRGTLIDGTEFDSSFKRGQPAELVVNQFVKGFSEALQMMSVGSKYEVYIPAELAYGERGAGGAVPPNAATIFTIELLAIK
jgi:FKBP-type peptidyl-prolyl cis-trans isomerase FklB